MKLFCTVLAALLLTASPAQALDIRKMGLKFKIGGVVGFHFFDSDMDLYTTENLTPQQYGEYPGSMALVGARFGVDYKDFTLETELGFIPASLSKSESFSPVVIGTLSGMYRFTRLIPKKYRITPFVKIDVGGMGIFADAENVQNDGDLIFGPGVGAMYDLTDRWSIRLDVNYYISDAVKNLVAHNFQVKAGFAWSFELDKDTDGDGIFDSKDKCPLQKEDFDNFEDTDGCPDLDNDKDGVPDKLDKCPATDKDALNNFKNTKEDRDGFQDDDGCPDLDNDKDGIPDAKDKCPGTDKDVATGFKATKEDKDGFQDDDGCPELDNDKDGVPDDKDKCRDVPEDRDGFEDDDGCPDLDNDKDGIPDTKDKCKGTDADKADNFIKTKEDKDGFEDDDGCPDLDNDRDGIPDDKDKCPGTEADRATNFVKTKEVINGYKDDDGCPDRKGKVRVIVLKEKVKILDRIYFTFGKASIHKRSFSLLRQIALTLKAHSQIKRLEIQGHTDSIGSASKNRDLSQRRAEAVRDFLVNAGVDASRLDAKGYGEERPLKKRCRRIRSRYRRRRCEKVNRRVEFIIIEQN